MFKNHGRLAAPEPDTLPMPPSPRPLVRKHHRKWPWILLAVVVLFGIAVAAGGGGGGPVTPVSSGTIVYKVTSDASTISATYATMKNGKVQEAQDNNTTPPWSTSVLADKGWAHGYSLAAQMNPAVDPGGHDGTTISCSITVGGKVIADNTSTGRYAVVTCSG